MSRSTAHDAGACNPVPGARREANGDLPLMRRTSAYGHFLACTGDIAQRPSALRSGSGALRSRRTSSAGSAVWARRPRGNLIQCALALWMLGYPDSSACRYGPAAQRAREIGQAATLMYALFHAAHIQLLRKLPSSEHSRRRGRCPCGGKRRAVVEGERDHDQGCVLALTGKAPDAVQMISAGIGLWRATGATVWMPLFGCIWPKPMRN